MWHRGEIFWQWADPSLHHRTHVETMENGVAIDVQARLSRTGATQLFIGIYAKDGQALYEEAFLKRPGETMTRALLWGAGKARETAEGCAATPWPTANLADKPRKQVDGTS
ncbi:hypothetical protein WLF18_05240 [Pseudomonas shirazensis]|uniref:Uncharacterized protein n=1 Tax=Pseudomonas shirazensis TaxID=2745494 RepID=A0ABU8ZVX0_9PSED